MTINSESGARDARHMSRRDVLALLSAGAAAAALSARVLVAEERSASAATPFALADVRLLDGPFRDAQEVNAKYLLSLDADRLRK